jgi:chromosome partitioning protein
MSAKVIAFINFKGGVGKTACVVNLGACLAGLHKKRVLIVDLDPQCNSSMWLMQPGHFWAHTAKGKRSTYQLFQDFVLGKHEFDFDGSVVAGVPRSEAGFPELATLDLLPGSVEMIRMEDQIHANKYARYFEYLSRALKPHLSKYDYILLDCAPNLYSVTKNALFAAQYCVVPYVPDFLSLSGFAILADEVTNFYAKVSGYLTGKKSPCIAALIVSHYRKVGNVFNSAINELEIQLQALKTEDLVHPRTEILLPYVRHCVGVAESTSEHRPVLLHQPSANGAADYDQLSSAFIAHFEETL